MATVTPESPQSLFLFFIAYSAVTIMYTPTYLYRYSTLSQVGGPVPYRRVPTRSVGSVAQTSGRCAQRRALRALARRLSVPAE